MARGRRVTLAVLAPLAGIVHPLSQVPDPLYAGGALGLGVALHPDHLPDERVIALAPCSGRVSSAMPHAVVLDAGGRSVLLHLGVGPRHDPLWSDALTMPGRQVSSGQPVLVYTPGAILEAGGSPLVPVVALRAHPPDVVRMVVPGERVEAGQTLLLWS